MATFVRKFSKHSKATFKAYEVGPHESAELCIHITTVCGYTGHRSSSFTLTKAEAAKLIEELQAITTR